MAYTDSSYGLFQGQMFIQERALNGAAISGYDFVGDVDMFTINPTQKFDDITESQSGLGLTAAHIITDTTVQTSFRALDIKMTNWIRSTWGGTSAVIASGSVTGEAVTFYNGQYTSLKNPGTALVLTTTPSLVLGTDYTYDQVNGMIYILPTSTVVAAGSPITGTAAYTRTAATGKVEAFITGQRYYRLKFQGRNTAQGNQPTTIVCQQWAPQMAKTLNIIAKKHIEFEMDGMLLQDTTIPLPSLATDLSQFFSITRA